jgi:hypothetical protein
VRATLSLFGQLLQRGLRPRPGISWRLAAAGAAVQWTANLSRSRGISSLIKAPIHGNLMLPFLLYGAESLVITHLLPSPVGSPPVSFCSLMHKDVLLLNRSHWRRLHGRLALILCFDLFRSTWSRNPFEGQQKYTHGQCCNTERRVKHVFKYIYLPKAHVVPHAALPCPFSAEWLSLHIMLTAHAAAPTHSSCLTL